MESPEIFWIRMFVLVTTVFGVSSMLLYGSIFEKPRRFWVKYTGFLGDLALCQLCISFWVTMALQWLILDYTDPIMYFFINCAVAGISWLLGAFTQANLWVKALCEKVVKTEYEK